MLLRLLLLPLAGCLSWNYTGGKVEDPGDDLDGDGALAVEAGGTDCWDDPATVPDGFTALNGLSQPTAAEVHPGAPDVPYDGVDADCAGDDDFDADGDGYASATVPGPSGERGDDCYDHLDDAYPVDACAPDPETLEPADIHPGAEDAPYDGTDADCAGDPDADVDGDGYAACDECDDADRDVNPGVMVEVWYDGVDQDCDGNDGDQDGDGYYASDYTARTGLDVPSAYHPESPDCWDDPTTIPAEFVALGDNPQPAADAVFPGAADAFYDGVDAGCDGGDDFDADGDGYASETVADREGAFGDDCADADPTIHPGVDEDWYDGVDQDCDGNDDDQDGDGFALDADCDDEDAAVNPGATERCDTAADDDCDDVDNEVDAIDCTPFYEDGDDDGYGVEGICLCAALETYTATLGGDCDDLDPEVNPGAPEAPADGVDADCDGYESCYEDGDGDGFGSLSVTSSLDFTCTVTDGVSRHPTDCDDSRATVHLGAPELCDGMENDCLGLWRSEAEDGLVSFESTSGTWSDATDAWLGESGEVAAVTPEEPGTWHVCTGAWEATVSTTTEDGTTDHSVAVVGHASSEVPRISGFSSGRPAFYAHSATLRVSAVTVDGGDGCLSDSGSTYGGLVCADGGDAPTTVYLEAVTLTNGFAQYGGAIAVQDDATVYVDDSIVEENVATMGGAFYADGGTVVLTNSYVYGNLASYGGGGAVVGEGAAGCNGDSAHDAGFFSNAGALGGGAVWLADLALFDASSCDFADNGNALGPNDVQSSSMEFASGGADQSFICDASGCS